jgi:hypothetical protein
MYSSICENRTFSLRMRFLSREPPGWGGSISDLS